MQTKLDYVGHLAKRLWIKDGKELSRNIPQGYRVYNSKGLGVSLVINIGGLGGHSSLYLVKKGLKEMFGIRRLTPWECFELMGLTREDFDKCNAMGLSYSQIYKQAGNGLVTNCVQFLAEHAYKLKHKDYKTTDELIVEAGYGCSEKE